MIAKREAMFNEYCPAEITDLLVKISKVGLRRIRNNNPFKGFIKTKITNKIPKSIKKTKRGLVRKKRSQRKRNEIAMPLMPSNVSLREGLVILDILLIL